MNLRKRALGLSLGFVWGLAIFAVTILSAFQHHGDTLVLLRGFYPGFTVSYWGAVIGLFWGFITGFIGGALIAWFYDFFFKLLYKKAA